MPIYEYQCSACAHRCEVLQKMSDAPLVNCPHCQQPKLSKLISRPAGFDLKGEGWYVTDFKNSGSASSAAKTSDEKVDAKSDSSSAEPAKPDTKPAEAAKTEAVAATPKKESKSTEN
ncbi:MAG: zinc ribbon domain-containing protein [Legionellales bacterium]|nr:zinc ribbon domain-containing protein [Legionellales bacterium]